MKNKEELKKIAEQAYEYKEELKKIAKQIYEYEVLLKEKKGRSFELENKIFNLVISLPMEDIPILDEIIQNKNF